MMVEANKEQSQATTSALSINYRDPDITANITAKQGLLTSLNETLMGKYAGWHKKIISTGL